MRKNLILYISFLALLGMGTSCMPETIEWVGEYKKESTPTQETRARLLEKLKAMTRVTLSDDQPPEGITGMIEGMDFTVEFKPGGYTVQVTIPKSYSKYEKQRLTDIFTV